MLTQIEIDGFKTFKDFKVELAPFQVIVGPNGSGKSNLFDALQLLSRLADDDMATAFQKLRGRDYEQFTALPGGKYTDRLFIAIEMLVDQTVRDDLGREAKLRYTRLRYELEITQAIDTYGLERLGVTHEVLRSLSENEDNWCRKYGISSHSSWLPEYADANLAFIATDKSAQTGNSTIHLYIEEHPYDVRETISFQADVVRRTVLSGVTDLMGFPHAFAVREEFRALQFLHLKPEAIRIPSSVKGSRSLASDGRNLPTTLARMQAEDRFALTDISRDMANLVPDLTHIELTKDEVRDEYTVSATYQDGRSFSSRVLSDGTLQLLALATLKNDQQLHGVLCFEEPENGVNPAYLKDIAHLLRGLATDFADPKQVDEPLRQVLITSHSPAFISLPEVVDSLLFAFMVTLVEPRKYSLEVTRMIPVAPSNGQENQNVDGDKAEKSYTLHQIEKYLDSKYLDEARAKFGRG